VRLDWECVIPLAAESGWSDSAATANSSTYLESCASWQTRIADAITRFTGSMLFVYIHLALFGFWIVANLRLIPRVPAWDDPFVILAMIASVEAIFLSHRPNDAESNGDSGGQARRSRSANQPADGT
jgi:hypothetical protein